MKKLLFCLQFCLASILWSLPNFIFIQPLPDNTLLITIDSSMHVDYGFAYPLTYQIAIPAQSQNLKAQVRFSKMYNWQNVFERTSEDFFNAKWAARFEYDEAQAFISVGFNAQSDSIYIRVIDEQGNTVPITFQQIPKFYDNRHMAVTLSADDMATWSQSKFDRSIGYTRAYNLWLTLSTNPAACNNSTWQYLQNQVNNGLIEIGNHTNTHPDPKPYTNYEYEVLDSKATILQKLNMPPLFRNGDHEYVYAYIAPHGYTDSVIDSLIGVGKYLMNRLYFGDFYGFSEWDEANGSFFPIGVTKAMDPPKSQLGWGIGTNDLDELNGAFDEAYQRQTVYHVMFHPNVVEWDKAYTTDHLAYIANRKDVWYVALGHLYLYHLAQTHYSTPTAISTKTPQMATHFSLLGNYPNPFNPSTRIRFQAFKPGTYTLRIFNPLGQLIENKTLVVLQAGLCELKWEALNNPSGVYFYQIVSEGKTLSSRMVKVK